MISTTDTKAPSYAGAFAVCGTDGFAVGGTDAFAGAVVRLRPVLDVPMTGLPIGATGARAVQLNIDTPGDLPPRDPLS